MTAYYNPGASASSDGYAHLKTMFALNTIKYRYDPTKAYAFARQPLQEQLDSVTKIGQVIEIQLQPTITTGTITASTGAVTVNAPYYTAKTITFDQTADATIGQTEIQGIQSSVDALKDLSTSMVEAVSAKANSYFCGLFDSVFTTNTGIGTTTTGASISVDNLLAAMKKLRLLDLPLDSKPEEFVFVLPAEASDILWLDERFSNACKTGQSLGGAYMKSVTTFRGIPIVFSTGVETTGTNIKAGALFHKDAILFGVQHYGSFDHEVNLAYARAKSVAWLYGGAEGRENYGVVMHFAV